MIIIITGESTDTVEMADNTQASLDTIDQGTWIQSIQEGGNKAEDWLAFTNCMQKPEQYGSDKTYISYMSSFFARAIKAINMDTHKDNMAYAQLLINSANLRGTYSIEDGRSVLQFARKCGKKLAIVYIASAQLEVIQGNLSKGRRFLEKGLQNYAEPEDLIHLAMKNLISGKTQLVPDESAVSKEGKENGEPLTKAKNPITKSNIGSEMIPSSVTLRSRRSNSNSSMDKLKCNQDTLLDSGDKLTNNPGFAVPLLPVTQYKPRSLSPRAMNPSSDDSSVDTTVDIMHGKVTTMRCQSGNQSDEGDTVRSTFDNEKGEYRRTLKTYNSTPDCKQPGVLSFSSRKTRNLGKPMRVKRTSLPQLTEGVLNNDDDDSLHLSPLPETDVFNMAMGEDVRAQAEFEDSKLEQKGMNIDRRMDEDKEEEVRDDTEHQGGDRDFSRQDSDSGVVTNLPSETLPATHDQSTGPTSSTVKAKIVPSSKDMVLPGIFSTPAQPSLPTMFPTTQVGAPIPNQQMMQPNVAAPLFHGQCHVPGQGMGQVQYMAPGQSMVPGQMMMQGQGMVPAQHMSAPMQGMVPGAFIPTPNNRQTDMLTVHGKMYTVLKMLGRGGSSKVYDTFDQSYNLRAVKCVNLDAADEATIMSYKNEIKLLKRLQHSSKVVKLFDYEYVDRDNMLYVVMERGDTDLASLFKQCNKSGGIDSLMQKFYWKEMLKAVEVLHKEGIVHSDLKPANFLLVAGNLKLIDFGISKALHQDMTSVTRDQQVGTLNYMSPEAIMDTCGGSQVDVNGRIIPKIKIGVKSDVWSLGCILYNLVYGKTPFSHISNNFLKLQAITSAKTQISFPEQADPRLREILMKCLIRDPKERPSISELLAYDY